MDPEAPLNNAVPSGGGRAPAADVSAPRWIWPLAGLAGGALAGFGDALTAVIRGVGGLGAQKAVWLVLLGASLLGAVGLLAGAAIQVFQRVVARAPGRDRRRQAVQIAAALASLPLWIYDGVAMFRGHRAAQMPGRHFISLLFAAIGATLVYRAAGRFADLLARLPQATPSQRRRIRTTAFALAALAIALQIANRDVLPRLYVWFHTSLSIWTTALAVLAARLLLGLRSGAAARAAAGSPVGRADRAGARRRWGRRLAAAAQPDPAVRVVRAHGDRRPGAARRAAVAARRRPSPPASAKRPRRRCRRCPKARAAPTPTSW